MSKSGKTGLFKESVQSNSSAEWTREGMVGEKIRQIGNIQSLIPIHDVETLCIKSDHIIYTLIALVYYHYQWIEIFCFWFGKWLTLSKTKLNALLTHLQNFQMALIQKSSSVTFYYKFVSLGMTFSWHIPNSRLEKFHI